MGGVSRVVSIFVALFIQWSKPAEQHLSSTSRTHQHNIAQVDDLCPQNGRRGEAGDRRATVREGSGVRAPIAGRSVNEMRFGI